jgi:RNA polymerase sigma-70 factor, ECF subfamily
VSVTQPDLPSRPPSEWGEAFAAICDRHRGRLIRWVTAIFGARDAEDIAQEALTRLYVRPWLLDPDADPWPWLAVVARNVGRDMLRHNAQSTTVEHDVLAALPGGDLVCEQVFAREDAAKLTVALRSLTSRERAVIRLRDFEGAAIGDIAEMMNLTENAVRQQLFRARRRLGSTYLALGGDRRTGLVALVGLKVREVYRRHSQLVEALTGSPAAVLAAALPSLAVVVGSTLTAVVPHPQPPLNTAGRASSVRDDGTARHGVAARAGRSPGGTRLLATAALGPTTVAPPRTPDADGMIRARPDVGPVHADADVSPRPFGEDEQTIDRQDIWIELPNGTRIHIWGYDGKPKGYGPVCRTGVVHCG